ncbi:TD and POZ domain-containing protein 5-like [Trichogramma pretiosum]|uniref:TD and POZ domain-containing protein 5-like n=1 Tax=Trichogramma pretiosum TaxID=7493 RepID=UPI0006C9746D|nr:TD and POZ domain-containing protein 5-like [Trichogramma pretiosum]XP_014226766.1 TD and POZ domain-containing protein 5-like [Trichogramma pretiosum]
MEEYTKATIQKKETNCIIFNIEYSTIKESTCMEYRSPSFEFKEHPKEECYISFVSVFSKDKGPSSQKVAGMTLHFSDKRLNEEVCTYQVVASVLNRPEFGIHAFQSHKYGINELRHWKFFSTNELLKVVNKSGIVQICFDVTRFCSGELVTIESTFVPQNDENMMKLYSFAKNGEYTDIVLKVGDQEIKAHKNILAARSKVFDAMFKSNMQEEQTGVINVVEFEAPVIKEMLYFMYTNHVEDLSQMVLKLYEAANFYNLIDLETLCKHYMISNITVENVTAISELADKYNLKNVQGTVNRFIKSNEAQVLKNQEYLTYLVSNISIKNIAKYLTLAEKYKLKEFKKTLKEFVRDNIKDVIKDSKYRYLYTTNMNLILEIDEYIADHYENNK